MDNVTSALMWLVLNLISSVILAFYSMQEMACVSFNKIRLEYYMRKGIKRAYWLNYLLEKPARLFGTTLIGVNAAMFFGSECARRSYEAMGLSPDWAPLSQVAFIIIFAELAPMFAARRYPEQVAFGGVPLLYLSSKILTPVLWLIHIITNGLDLLLGVTQKQHKTLLNQEELQQLLEAQDEDNLQDSGQEKMNTIARNILNFRSKDAKAVMQPLSAIPLLPFKATVKQLRKELASTSVTYIPVYLRRTTQIVGVATPRDFLRVSDNRFIGELATPPWFLTHHTPIMQVIKDFRRNKKDAAIVLDDQGLAIGMLTRGELSDWICGTAELEEEEVKRPTVVVDRTLPANMTVAEFNKQFDLDLDADPKLTLAEVVTEHLGHHPENGESLFLDPFEITVKEVSLTGIRTLSVRTRLD